MADRYTTKLVAHIDPLRKIEVSAIPYSSKAELAAVNRLILVRIGVGELSGGGKRLPRPGQPDVPVRDRQSDSGQCVPRICLPSKHA